MSNKIKLDTPADIYFLSHFKVKRKELQLLSIIAEKHQLNQEGTEAKDCIGRWIQENENKFNAELQKLPEHLKTTN